MSGKHQLAEEIADMHAHNVHGSDGHNLTLKQR